MSLQLDQTISRSRPSSTCRPEIREIRMDGVKVGRWLEYLETLSPFGEHGKVLTDFWDTLRNACWLANWKREYVILEIDVTTIPALIEVILSDKPGAHPERNLAIEEEILATLSELRN